MPAYPLVLLLGSYLVCCSLATQRFPGIAPKRSLLQRTGSSLYQPSTLGTALRDARTRVLLGAEGRVAPVDEGALGQWD